MENILEVNNVSKKLGNFKLDGVTFSLPKGYIMGFVGPNGAGKTTTIKLIMGLMHKDSGLIKVFGEDHIQFEKEIKQRLGFVYDENYFYEDLRVEEIKRIISSFYGRWDEGVFRSYAADFDINPKMKIKQLSKGMKMKFSLALALSHHAEFIIMDEPTSGLDPVFRSELISILTDMMQDENRGILFSTHITTDLEKVADYICFINKGKIMFNDTKDEVISSHAVVKGGADMLHGPLKDLLCGVRTNEFGFEALTTRAAEVKGLFGDKVLVEKASLDDIILFIVRGKQIAKSN